MERDSRWLQVHCALFTDPSGDRPSTPWRELADAVEGWRRLAAFRWFFFQRKPPGLRLRFCGPDVEELLKPDVAAWLGEAERAGLIRGCRFTVYEPEVERFGGPAGMALAHELFDRDAAVALAYEALDDRNRGEVSRHVVSAAICTDLFEKSLEDRAEVWDIWARLARDLPRDRPMPELGDDKLVTAAVALDEPFWAALTPAVSALVRGALRDNGATGAGLRAAADTGRLTVGPRTWLVSAATFHRNRLGLGLEMDEMIATTVRARDALEID